jgi:hypothetical protein
VACWQATDQRQQRKKSLVPDGGSMAMERKSPSSEKEHVDSSGDVISYVVVPCNY